MKQILSPSQTVKAHCQECLGLKNYNRQEVEACKGDTCKTGPCPFHPYRLGKRISVKVFRAFCFHCMGGQPRLISECPSTDCRIYPYRMGKNPSRQGIGNHRDEIGREFREKEQDSTIIR